MTTCVKNLKMSGISTAVKEMAGSWPNIRELWGSVLSLLSHCWLYIWGYDGV